MRRTINISVPEEMYEFIVDSGRYTSVSEYIRGLVERDRQQRADYALRPIQSRSANDSLVIGEALEQLDKLKAILERDQ
ncbi:MAG: type II toxin-antitoxin system ParD family antitoxin [Pyrinomonadaceae bacterium]